MTAFPKLADSDPRPGTHLLLAAVKREPVPYLSKRPGKTGHKMKTPAAKKPRPQPCFICADDTVPEGYRRVLIHKDNPRVYNGFTRTRGRNRDQRPKGLSRHTDWSLAMHSLIVRTSSLFERKRPRTMPGVPA